MPTYAHVSLVGMRVLGIETSCDETGAAVVDDGSHMLSNSVASSMALHAKYGGVVPEIAARMQLEAIIPSIDNALEQATTNWDQIDAIAVTYGAGLGSSLLIGVMTARTLAITEGKPLLACNHVLGHIYASFISSTSLPGYSLPEYAPSFPLLAVILSGGHSQLVLFSSHFKYRILGRTQDDAIGEAFDKVAKLLGLPYPGGPSIAKLATKGDARRYKLPIAKMPSYDFSFSGLKTAVLRLAQDSAGVTYDFPSFRLSERLSEAQKADIAASFERVAIDTVMDKVMTAIKQYKPKSVVLAGGVASNTRLRQTMSLQLPCPLIVPDTKLCTDNGAMIAALGGWQLSHNFPQADPYSLSISTNLSM